MPKDLFDNNNDFFRENIENSMLHEFKKFKKHKKSNKKKQKKLKRQMMKMKKRIKKEVMKEITKKLERKYRKKYKSSKYIISPDYFDRFIYIKPLIQKSPKKTLQLHNNVYRLGENELIIDVPYEENEK